PAAGSRSPGPPRPPTVGPAGARSLPGRPAASDPRGPAPTGRRGPRSRHLSDRDQQVTLLVQQDLLQPPLRWPRHRVARLGVEHAVVAGAEQSTALRLVVDRAGKVRTPLAVGDEPPAGQVQEHRLLLRARVVEVKRPALRYLARPRDRLDVHVEQAPQPPQDGDHRGGGEQRAGGENGELKELTPRDELVRVPVVGELGAPALHLAAGASWLARALAGSESLLTGPTPPLSAGCPSPGPGRSGPPRGAPPRSAGPPRPAARGRPAFARPAHRRPFG